MGTSSGSNSSASSESPIRLVREEGGVGKGAKGGFAAGALISSAIVDTVLVGGTYAFVLVFLVLCGVSSPSAAADFLFLGVTCTEDISIYRSSRIKSISFVLVQLSIQRQVRPSDIIGGYTSTALLIRSGYSDLSC